MWLLTKDLKKGRTSHLEILGRTFQAEGKQVQMPFGQRYLTYQKNSTRPCVWDRGSEKESRRSWGHKSLEVTDKFEENDKFCYYHGPFLPQRRPWQKQGDRLGGGCSNTVRDAGALGKAGCIDGHGVQNSGYILEGESTEFSGLSVKCERK